MIEVGDDGVNEDTENEPILKNPYNNYSSISFGSNSEQEGIEDDSTSAEEDDDDEDWDEDDEDFDDEDEDDDI